MMKHVLEFWLQEKGGGLGHQRWITLSTILPTTLLWRCLSRNSDGDSRDSKTPLLMDYAFFASRPAIELPSL